MTKGPEIKIRAILDMQATELEINKQLKLLEKKLQPIRLRTVVDKQAQEQMNQQMGTATTGVKQHGDAIKDLTTKTKTYGSQVKQTTTFVQNLSESVVTAVQKFALWVMIGNVVMQVFRIFRQGIQDLRDIDEQLTQLRKVSGESLEVMREYAFEANEAASRLGVTTVALIEQTTAWARLGYSIRDASKLAEESTLLSIVGNMEINRATTALVSTIKAFNYEVDQSREIIDMVNEVGNRYAISQEDITEILKRSSAAMREANNSLAETIALGVGAQE